MKYQTRIKLFIYSVICTFIMSSTTLSQNPKVKLGIDVLLKDNFEILKGKKVALVTNPSGVDGKLNSTIDILHSGNGFDLVSLFGPEHGIRGDVEGGDKVDNSTDSKTGLPIYSLYGSSYKPDSVTMNKFDLFIYDIQDIGCRSYTYISTLGKIMESAAEFKKKVIVLDRPNPLGGNRIEGNIVEDGFFSFIGQYQIPYVYGLTVGELAKLINDEGMLKDGVKCDLEIVAMEGWKRDYIFEDTGLMWVPTSPHIPHKDSPFFYVMSGVVGELRDVISIGVGYTLPFQTFAYQNVNGIDLARNLNALEIEGLRFMPISYTPYYAFSKGETISGVEVFITNHEKAPLMKTQFYVLQELKKLFPDYNIFEATKQRHLTAFDKAMGTDKVRLLFSENFKVSDIEEYLNKDIEEFKELSKKYYLYD